MGQIPSALQLNLQRNMQVWSMRHDELVTAVQELNSLLISLPDRGGKKMCLRIVQRSFTGDETVVAYAEPTTAFWKFQTRIICQAEDEDGSLTTARVLNLKQFCSLYGTIKDHLSGQAEDDGLSRMRASTFIREFQAADGGCNECSICFDVLQGSEGQLTDVESLPCTHVFHGHCLRDWTSSCGSRGGTCPICRSNIEGEDSSWSFVETPDQKDVSSYWLEGPEADDG